MPEIQLDPSPEQPEKFLVKSARFMIEPIGYPISLISRHEGIGWKIFSGGYLLMSFFGSGSVATDAISRGSMKELAASLLIAWGIGKCLQDNTRSRFPAQ